MATLNLETYMWCDIGMVDKESVTLDVDKAAIHYDVDDLAQLLTSITGCTVELHCVRLLQLTGSIFTLHIIGKSRDPENKYYRDGWDTFTATII